MTLLDKHPLLVKALRMTLVFAVVFTLSLHLETLALATSVEPRTLQPDDTVLQLWVYEPDEPEEGEGGSLEPDPEEPASLGTLVRDTEACAKDEQQTYTPMLSERGGSMSFNVVASVRDNAGEQFEDVDVSDCIEWKLEKTDLVTLDPKTGTITANPDIDKSGSVKLTVTLKADYIDLIDPEFAEKYPDKDFVVTFSVIVGDQSEPYISSIELLDENGEQITGEGNPRSLSLEAGTETYSFQARVDIYDPAENKNTPYTITGENGLYSQTDGAFSDLQWSLEDGGEAAIDEFGTVTFNGSKSAVVVCETQPLTEEEEAHTDRITVQIAEDQTAPEPPYVSKLDILKTDGSALDEGGVLPLTVEGTISYQFGVRVEVTDPEQPEGENVSTYTFANGSWDVDGELPFKIAWTAPEGITISETGVLELTEAANLAVTCTATPGVGNEPVIALATVNADKKEEKPDEKPDEDKLKVGISYVPVPEGEMATISARPYGVHGITYVTYWEESLDEGKSWTEIDGEYTETLRRPTTSEFLGRQYRARIEIIDVSSAPQDLIGAVAYSDPEVLRVGDGAVTLLVGYVPEGETTLFTTVLAKKLAQSDSLTYSWEESADDGESWVTLAEGYLPTYSVLTERSRFGHLFRVWVTDGRDGKKYESNVQMLAADATDYSDGSGDDSSVGFDDDEPTLSEQIDEQGSVTVTRPDGSTANMSALGNIVNNVNPEPDGPRQTGDTPTGDKPDLHIDPTATQKISEQKKAEQDAINASQPGARWNPIYPINETEDPNEALKNSLLARLAGPLALAMLAAGALEKFLRYRNQRRPSLTGF